MSDKGWMKWNGCEQPVSGHTYVEIEQADGKKFEGSANAFYWGREDDDDTIILRWRIIPECKFRPLLCPHCGKPI